MSKKDFYISVVVFSLIGASYVAAMIWSITVHNYNALCGYFCAACLLAVAFMWYCDNQRLKSLLPKHDMNTYWFVFKATSEDGHNTIDITAVGKCSKVTEKIIDIAKESALQKMKENGDIGYQDPVLLNVIKLDE